MIDLGSVPLQSQGWQLVKGKRVARKYFFTIHAEVAVAFELSPAPIIPYLLSPARLAEILAAENRFVMSLLKKK